MGIGAHDHDQACAAWRRFREVVDTQAFRASARRFGRSVLASATRPTSFEVALERPHGGSYAFGIHQPQGASEILCIDDVVQNGALDQWNRHVRSLRQARKCVHPFAVVLSVNGKTGNNVAMAEEFVHDQITMLVVNPPTVWEVLGVMDLLRYGELQGPSFWTLAVPQIEWHQGPPVAWKRAGAVPSLPDVGESDILPNATHDEAKGRETCMVNVARAAGMEWAVSNCVLRAA